MMWSILFCAVISGVLSLPAVDKKVAKLKQEWKHHEKYRSSDYFWSEVYGNGSLQHPDKTWMMLQIEEQRIECILQGMCPTKLPSVRGANVPCNDDGEVVVNGETYSCNGISLDAFVSLADLGSNADNADGNDIWGYYANGRYYALTGQTDGASIVDITDSENPEVLVFIPTTSTLDRILWRDLKVTDNGYLYIVADGLDHGLQYMHLDTLIATARAQSERPFRAVLDTDYFVSRDITNSHNVITLPSINAVYSCGSRNDQQSSGGIIRYVTNPTTGEPTVSGVYSADSYTHDAECVIYRGPDVTYQGKEVCFGYQGGNPNELLIVLVETDANNEVQWTRIAHEPYVNASYTHQGWLSDDHRFLFMNDEADESRHGVNTRTIIVDLTKGLANPEFKDYFGPTLAIDHNLYVVGDMVYEANYKAGLRVLHFDDETVELEERYHFQTWTGGDIDASFNGMWSNYPYFVSETCVVVAQDIEKGLYVLRMDNCTPLQKEQPEM